MKRPINDSHIIFDNHLSADTTAPTTSRSSESAKDCRKRKALRIQYLAESVRLRELTVIKMKRDIDKLLELCRYIDQGEIPVSLLEKCGISV
ncbi:cAMP-responsive element-binding protein-like 2 isoform 2 [Schistosoma japonicum]|uniref:cAMP-responsive element-binding protein-like 2 isoform 2 n=1 Tax=Schistosoma japonicum TaxID=6182 RepID=C1LG47_SCHJA|nr:cAMP-responsive element-binding protein-like 2 [Schistosoma japonicum]KAH8849053.1 cAMP-responsive element-binding protein-like 2 [Schistosoma japonicum]KAH8849054.1 cAMP-responsive element-binding protein-like 2 [Schistosoma japonicum]KAH8849055.1 cAMP-responsive element-binding protein-like 2 [Schistosoma japonicum]KAH8849056.1 cAMP-responsive element-binding protein-like 2 [Schistosoma japonicum]